MPITVLNESIAKYLKDIDFNNDKIVNPSIDNTLKNSILKDDSVTINIHKKTAFYVHIKARDYHEMLLNTFYFNYNRFTKQCDQIELLLQSRNSAWLLTTIYYACFFAANEISNLHGLLNLTITNDEKAKLISRNISSEHDTVREFLTEGPTHFFGRVKFINTDNTIQILFESGGGKPHELAWNNLDKTLKTLKNGDSSNRTIQILRIKNILSNKNRWNKPNQIRNEWNYSKAELYLEEGDRHRYLFDKYKDDLNELNRWSNSGRGYRKGTEDDIISILYLYKILKSVIEEQKIKILD